MKCKHWYKSVVPHREEVSDPWKMRRAWTVLSSAPVNMKPATNYMAATATFSIPVVSLLGRGAIWRMIVHWLPVGHRITYKLCLTTWKTLHTSQPLYLSELISHYVPPRSLRSSNTNLLTRPAGITRNFSSRAFSVSAPSTWNSLPAHIRSIDTLSTFKCHLKFHLFQSAFTV